MVTLSGDDEVVGVDGYNFGEVYNSQLVILSEEIYFRVEGSLYKQPSQLQSPWAKEPKALKSNGSNFCRAIFTNKINNNYHALREALKIKLTQMLYV